MSNQALFLGFYFHIKMTQEASCEQDVHAVFQRFLRSLDIW
uniref:Uncharacterized protein n=1 Tax=Anguilla anguilla TaxID=7936 RepID=A0A0E9RBL8_ANGAN